MNRSPTTRNVRRLAEADYRRLLLFRDGLRQFLRWSEAQARAIGLSAGQHQLLLAVRGHGEAPSIADVADHLLLRHHSVVGLVDRVERLGLLRRVPDPTDHRVVRLHLTPQGEAKLAELGAAHLEELSRLRPRFDLLWDHLPT